MLLQKIQVGKTSLFKSTSCVTRSVITYIDHLSVRDNLFDDDKDLNIPWEIRLKDKKPKNLPCEKMGASSNRVSPETGIVHHLI